MKYWVYLKGEVPGSFSPAELAGMAGFELTTLVCPAEGEILEKNWRRAGEFDDLAGAVQARPRPAEPLPASLVPAPPPPLGEVDALIDATGARLFGHVAGLMKELETRREERALALSLRRQLAALKQELLAASERASFAEARLPRIGELEQGLRQAQAEAASLRDAGAARDASFEELRAAAEKSRFDLEGAKRRLEETVRDLAVRNRLVDKLSKDLSEKEVSLTKSLALIRRLEEEMRRLGGAEELEPGNEPVASVAAPAPLAPPAPQAPAGSYTQDEPPAVPPYLEPRPPETPRAQEALLKLLRKVLPGPSH